jgi:hypothetical protein
VSYNFSVYGKCQSKGFVFDVVSGYFTEIAFDKIAFDRGLSHTHCEAYGSQTRPDPH